jgi:dihydrodipicolinate synthase/N-acetylneuraminate lyase
MTLWRLPLIAVGGDGLVSVVSNEAPALVAQLVNLRWMAI